MTCEEANEAASDQYLAECNDVEFLKSMIRELRKKLAEARFAAALNQETIKNRGHHG